MLHMLMPEYLSLCHHHNAAAAYFKHSQRENGEKREKRKKIRIVNSAFSFCTVLDYF